MTDGSITNLFNNTFANNTAIPGTGGAISCPLGHECSTNIYDNNFTGNTAYHGGAISQGTIENVYNNRFVKNIALGSNQDDGGGAICSSHISNLYNNLFKDNEAAGTSYSCRWGGGGAIKLWADDYIINLYNNSFINSKNQAICIYDSTITNLYNNIFAFNDTAINKDYYATISNLNYNAYWQNDTNCMGISCGENDVDFTSNPFLGDDSDKNFLIVSSQVNIVRDKGINIGDDTFFNSKTIGVDGILDTGTRDIGYHYNLMLAGDCFDNIKNGNELGIDCDGRCSTTCQQKYGNCVPIIKNGNPNEKIDVVFVGSGFPDLNKFAEVVDEMIDYDGQGHGLMSEYPFNHYKDHFNFWRINFLPELSLGNFDFGSQLIGTTCHADQIVLLSVSPRFVSHSPTFRPFPATYLFIGEEYLQDCHILGGNCTHPWPIDVNPNNWADPNCQGDGNRYTGCGPYGDNKGDVQRTFLHEFGHSFGGLHDEYLSPTEANKPHFPAWLVPNCDSNGPLGEPACQKWDSITGDWAKYCIPGCYYNDWYRAYDKTIMNYQFDWSVDYNKVNEKVIEDNILRNTGQSVGGNSNYSYIVDLNYVNGNATFLDVNLVYSTAPNSFVYTNNDYKLKIISDENNPLYDVNFNFPIKISYSKPTDAWDENGTQIDFNETIVDLNNTRILVAIPYFANANLINIYDKNENLVSTQNISNLKPIEYILGYGGNQVQGTDYNLTYTITPQPLKILIGENYTIQLGLN